MSEKKNETIEIEAAWIRQLAALMQEEGLTEIELEKANVRLRVSRGAQAIAAQVAPAAAASAGPAPAAMASAEAAPARPAAEHPGAVVSPMVGTAYLKPAPDAQPFVKVGDRVAAGQTLMIVEAMKTMNPIASPRDGVVKEILVKDAQPVEFGEPLMIVE
ncbi:acetyl-CoA carboxylase biotin carboxyl carrier protein [Amphiplicatus metriothermophilus]|uniref:Biotin carboxyl carrier protein of acetyl-CoA carboxylase n=1 Tax=Amphiplicatus metriothermophilus TaxID=1519374 RepID=A0A239PVN9_9PROT|nr:acetyl-CoA carboxylase biotin carboxyl carrier protein [Amphiplicatus metriothermophilus]MBB5519614.1 acetyl-CoA carboxylase biotin carboxyl carrier protein [Amphiplicatus metriothermophilus]SNT74178.1 biotin carboxyl carrier protein [Amphiplicatus metriothermophilus]